MAELQEGVTYQGRNGKSRKIIKLYQLDVVYVDPLEDGTIQHSCYRTSFKAWMMPGPPRRRVSNEDVERMATMFMRWNADDMEWFVDNHSPQLVTKTLAYMKLLGYR